ncbi:MAG TPA: HAMP domain-containing histidine kinase [Clostridiaceae bacterium]|nr:HAMP domain-containing histidine kinase [Clostridiaceae bacterium]
MDFFRNPEIRKSAWLWFLLNISLISISSVIDIKYGMIAVFYCIIFDFAHFISTFKRYRHIAELSHEIDKILHDSSKFDLNRFAEGELSILHSEIYKMTVRLREQADALKKDKTYLADSIADISHQIRTPLTSINLIANFLTDEDLSDERRITLAKDLLRLLSRIDWLISTLLKISKLDTGTVRFAKNPVNVSDLIRKSAEPLAIPMDLRNQKLIVKAKGDEHFIGDFSWTAEAVENILKNCMEHTPPGGTITVKVKETPIFTELTITDTGTGIAPEDLPHLFERFYKGKSSKDSNIGIGLALSRMIVTAQNGTIKVENCNNGGACFTVRFYKCTV